MFGAPYAQFREQIYKYFLDYVQKVLLLMYKLTNLVDIVHQRMVYVCFICVLYCLKINVDRKMLTCYLVTCFVFDVCVLKFRSVGSKVKG